MYCCGRICRGFWHCCCWAAAAHWCMCSQIILMLNTSCWNMSGNVVNCKYFSYIFQRKGISALEHCLEPRYVCCLSWNWMQKVIVKALCHSSFMWPVNFLVINFHLVLLSDVIDMRHSITVILCILIPSVLMCWLLHSALYSWLCVVYRCMICAKLYQFHSVSCKLLIVVPIRVSSSLYIYGKDVPLSVEVHSCGRYMDVGLIASSCHLVLLLHPTWLQPINLNWQCI
jgi:hypothetical protein